MELVDLIKKASEGTLHCPKCREAGMFLQNVRVSMEAGKPKVDPNTYGLCKKCGAKVSIDKLLKGSDSAKSKPKWQFWK